MRVFAIGDLHLPGGQDKPMDVFGGHWDGHFEKIASDWTRRVGADDIVLLPGDLSWAMTLEDALPDLGSVFALPGRKILLRGNHDYWWPSISRLRAAVPDRVYVLQNDALLLDGVLFAGTRGWLFPKEEGKLSQQDEKIYLRELARLELSLTAARKLSAQAPLVCMMHYPPLAEDGTDTGFTALLRRYGARVALYGHLHAEGLAAAYNGEKDGILYRCCSCDGLRFKLYELENVL